MTDGKALTETEALDGKLIDLIANSPEDLLAKLDGRTIKRFDGSTMQLALHNPQARRSGHVRRASDFFRASCSPTRFLFC